MSDISSAQTVWDSFMKDELGSVAKVLGQTAARAALSSFLPKDFEYYMLAFELVDIHDRTVDYFVFPVMPDSYQQVESATMSVKKTMGGISVVNNPTFNPVDITISGNFGRKFSIISGKTPHPAVAQYSTTTGMFSKLGMAGDKLGKFRKMVLGSRVKTGFGAIQIMRGIIDKSRGEIDGQPLRLYMYNPAFDANYVVKVANAKYFQSRGTNMIWNYDLQIKGVAPLDVMARDSRVRLAASVGFNLLSKTATQTLDAVNNLMGAS